MARILQAKERAAYSFTLKALYATGFINFLSWNERYWVTQKENFLVNSLLSTQPTNHMGFSISSPPCFIDH